MFVGFLGVTLATLHTYSLGVMIGPIEQEFGWSRAQISAGMAIQSFLSVLLAPVVGLAIDRHGPRRIAIIGCAVYCLMIALLSSITANIWSWRAIWVGIAIGQAFISPSVWTAAASSLFTTRRGLAQAITLCGTGLGVGLMPILTTIWVDAVGWRNAYIGLGASWAILLIPLLFIFFAGATDRARSHPSDEASASSELLPGYTVLEGLRSRAFIILVTAAIIYSLALTGIHASMVPILISQGLSREVAASITGGMAVGVIIGRLSAGYLFDRINARFVSGLSVGLSIVSALLLLFYPGSVPISAAAVFLYGLLLGPTFTGFAFLATQHLGLRAFGTLFGVIVGVLTLCSGVAVIVVNHVYDLTHSYRLVLEGAVIGALLTALLFLMMGNYPDFAKVPDTAD